MSSASGEQPPGLVFRHDLDPVEHRALHQALARLPAGAVVAGPEPLTPSIRAVLDRFLSTQLRAPLRALGLPEGPAAVVVGRLGAGADAQEPGSVNHNPALASWLIEAAGLFRAPIDLERARPRLAAGYNPAPDHLLLFVRSLPPSAVRFLGIASVATVEAKTTIQLNIGTAVVLDRRRALVHVDRVEHRLPWLARIELVADPWSAATSNVENYKDTRP